MKAPATANWAKSQEYDNYIDRVDSSFCTTDTQSYCETPRN
jgi:hypothetical protein